jgi:hypothetical protein
VTRTFDAANRCHPVRVGGTLERFEAEQFVVEYSRSRERVVAGPFGAPVRTQALRFDLAWRGYPGGGGARRAQCKIAVDGWAPRSRYLVPRYP